MILIYSVHSPFSKPSHIVQYVKLLPTFDKVDYVIRQPVLVTNMDKSKVLQYQATTSKKYTDWIMMYEKDTTGKLQLYYIVKKVHYS